MLTKITAFPNNIFDIVFTKIASSDLSCSLLVKLLPLVVTEKKR